jgi:hypothetical protein
MSALRCAPGLKQFGRDSNQTNRLLAQILVPSLVWHQDKHRIDGGPFVGAQANQEQRRSERVRLAMAVLVMTETREREQVQEETHTVTVSAHGGLFRLKMEVLTGQPMVLVNVKTSQEQSCRVVRVQDMPEGDFGVAFEFDHPAPDFWCVTFPPADWNLVRT